MMKKAILSLWPFALALFSAASVGLALPSILIGLGYAPLLVAMFIVAMFAVLIDGLVTKIGQIRAMTEINPIIDVLAKRIGSNGTLILSRLIAVGILLYGLLTQSFYMLLALGWLFLMLIFASMLGMLISESRSNGKKSDHADKH